MKEENRLTKNQLPEHFQSWNHFFLRVNGSYLEHLDTVVEYIDAERGLMFEIEIDYMKARCFDEIKREEKNWIENILK